MFDKSTTFFSSIQATTGNPLPEKYAIDSPESIEQALEAAAAATLAFAQTTAKQRAHFLSQIASEIEARSRSILSQYQKESGLPEGRANGELQRTLGQIQHFVALLEAGRYIQATIHKTDTGPDLRKMLYPIGPIVVFGASNFPLAFSTAGGDTISALAAGCPVLVKAHPYHIGTSSLVAEAIAAAVHSCSLHPGVFAHLADTGHGLGQKLVQDPRVKGVGFTGSYAGGKALCELAQKRTEPIPVFAEMGSTNPMVVLQEKLQDGGADLAQAIADSVLLGNGQFCTNPGLIFTLGAPTAAFLEKLKSVFATAKVGVMVHPNIAQAYQEKLNALKGKYSELQMIQNEPNGPALGQIHATSFQKHLALSEEVFGPFTLLVVHDTPEQLAQSISKMEGQLTATLLGTAKDHQKFPQMQQLLLQKVGRLLFEGVPTGVAVTTAMQHGGPYPASSDSRFTAVGSDAILRWLRPVCYQDAPQENLPQALQDHNPLNIERNCNNLWTKDPL